MARRSLVEEIDRLVSRAAEEADRHHQDSLRHTEAAQAASAAASASAKLKAETEALRKTLASALGR